MPDREREGTALSAGLISMEQGRAENLPEVRRLSQACAEAPHWPPDAWQSFVQPSSYAGDRRSVLLLARASGGELLGWLAATCIYETAELEFLLIHPAHRRRGMAGRLMKHWLAWAKDHGALEALLEVRPSNAAAIRLYRACGFMERGRRQRYYDNPPEDALLMWCALGPTPQG